MYSECTVYPDVSIGSLNWISSVVWSCDVVEWVCWIGWSAVSVHADSDGPKVTNDSYGYDAGDCPSEVAV